jgi:hypothetical protein
MRHHGCGAPNQPGWVLFILGKSEEKEMRNGKRSEVVGHGIQNRGISWSAWRMKDAL